MNCEVHEDTKALAVWETNCCAFVIPWCAACALGSLDFMLSFPDEEITCNHCGADTVVKNFISMQEDDTVE